MHNNIYRQQILPRLCFFPYFLTKLILTCLSASQCHSKSNPPLSTDAQLCIEAGTRGWDSIELKELYQSACEYLGADNLHRLVVHQKTGYIQQISNIFEKKRITHYLFDPRTGNPKTSFWLPVWQSIRIAIFLHKRGIIPIVLLTDLAVRSWRTQAAVVSASRGVVVCFMAPSRVQAIFPHNRLVGPSLMPFSVKTLSMLDQLMLKKNKNNPPKAMFTGSLYEPRTTKLHTIREGLKLLGVDFELRGRTMGSARISDLEYWSCLTFSDIVVTTSDQAIQVCADWNHVPHLIYRYLEVLASGSLLIAQDVPCVRRYFTPGIHFIAFESCENAISLISHYLDSEDERLAIANQGKHRADALIKARSFWVQIDTCLGKNSIL